MHHVIYCKNFPTTSNFEYPKILRTTRNENEKTEQACIMDGLTDSRNSAWKRKIQHRWSQHGHAAVGILSDIEILATELLNDPHSGEKIIPERKDIQIWRAEKREASKKWDVGKKRSGSKKWDFNWKWYKLRPFCFILLLLVTRWPTQALTRNGNNGYCESNIVPLLVTPHVVTSAIATLFARTCRCTPDWRSHFCSQVPRYKSLLAVQETYRQEEDQLPTVCICRQFTPENNCQQFMTQCFYMPKNKRNECACCFNQPGAFCNQLQCHNGEPVFGSHANTTCICHTPTFYPYNICTHQTTLFYDQEEVTLSNNGDDEMSRDYIKYPLHGSQMQHEESSAIMLYGLKITPAVAIAIVLGLLGTIMLLTMILLVVRACRTHREHRNRATKRELAQSVLLEQRAEEEKYLP